MVSEIATHSLGNGLTGGPNSDDSSSMYTDDDGARVKTLHTLLKAVAEVYELAREEGIMSVRYLNGRQGRKNVTKAKVDEVHEAIRYHGLTMIGTQLQEKILKPFVEKKVMTKPLLTMIITDGAVSSSFSSRDCTDRVSRSRVRVRGFWRKISTIALLVYKAALSRRRRTVSTAMISNRELNF